MNNSEVLTIICFTYNHVKFIRKTLEGFISQKTDYKFRVIVHDDASTDGTQSIIKEYEDKYPNLFRCIYQTENTYSRGINAKQMYVRPLVQSKYVALCEGDDYWCDELKIQQQLSYMEKHQDTMICAHNTSFIDFNGEELKRCFNYLAKDKDYSFSDVLKAGGGGLFHYSSLLMKTEIYFDIPDLFKLKGVGDYPLALYAASIGNIHYIGRVMSCYRTNNPNSWVGKHKNDAKRMADHYYDEYLFLENIQNHIKGYNHSYNVAKGRCIYMIKKNGEKTQKYGLHLNKCMCICSFIFYRISLYLIKKFMVIGNEYGREH